MKHSHYPVIVTMEDGTDHKVNIICTPKERATRLAAMWAARNKMEPVASNLYVDFSDVSYQTETTVVSSAYFVQTCKESETALRDSNLDVTVRSQLGGRLIMEHMDTFCKYIVYDVSGVVSGMHYMTLTHASEEEYLDATRSLDLMKAQVSGSPVGALLGLGFVRSDL